jgi:hypothetical protein
MLDLDLGLGGLLGVVELRRLEGARRRVLRLVRVGRWGVRLVHVGRGRRWELAAMMVPVQS